MSQIRKETESDETKLNMAILNEPRTNTYSAALLAFVRVKVFQALSKIAGNTPAGELQYGHSEMWAKALIDICDSVRNLERMGHQRVLNGVALHKNPSEEALNKIVARINGNCSEIASILHGNIESMDEE